MPETVNEPDSANPGGVMTLATVTKHHAETCTIEIRRHNTSTRNPGNYLVFVENVHWGRIHTTWHGRHGTVYHLSDFNGAVGHDEPSGYKHRADRFVEVQTRLPPKQPWHSTRPRATVIEVMTVMVRKAIASGDFRHPQVRAAEISEAKRVQEAVSKRIAAEQEAEWNARIDVVIRDGDQSFQGLGPQGKRVTFHPDELREAIHAAMKWAQSK